ncbi:MAG: hypothetical protein CMA21_00125 [Euryarchaeota archaeon]|nr:hypothetical protein [Euryarchaeota archaeon]|tara:strand:+ start:141 stop:416 length:276 start_codon:yes stop_codon:yes gene_type:complete
MNERIPRREAPDFRDSEDGLISSIVEDGFLNVALDDANQYGPHAMILFLGVASILTGSILGLAMIDPLLSIGGSILLVGGLLIANFRLSGA